MYNHGGLLAVKTGDTICVYVASHIWFDIGVRVWSCYSSLVSLAMDKFDYMYSPVHSLRTSMKSGYSHSLAVFFKVAFDASY